MKINQLLLGLVFLVSLPIVAKETKPLVSDGQVTKDIQAFAKQMSQQHQFDEKLLVEKLSSLKPNPEIIRRMTKPAESLPWFQYRNIWMKDQRIDAGVAFWQANQKTLAKAEQEFGVDPSIIVGIIGVESFFGKHKGGFAVLQALHTLGFYYPKRSTFFRSELAEYLLLARQQGWPLESINGSYAGAMGMGQFISSSYRHYGIDFNQDGKVNLFTDTEDMIGSVANYFAKHHWRKDGFVAVQIDLQPHQKKLVQFDLKLKYSLAELKAQGIDVSALKQKSVSAGVFEFELTDGKKQNWLVGDNFYVITRYNHNAMYALAVVQLAKAIADRREQDLTQNKP